MRNQDIRAKIMEEGLKHWEVAEVMKIHEGNFSRLLRKELNNDKKNQVLTAVEKAKQMKKEGAL